MALEPSCRGPDGADTLPTMKPAPTGGPIEVSVVVATCDRPERLDRLLTALDRQSLERSGFEVVVVDDASQVPTRDLLEARAADGIVDRVVRRTVRAGPATARNSGWRVARGRLIAFTDDDCEPSPEWLEILVAVGREAPDAVIQGRTQPNPSELDARGPYSRTLEVTRLGPWYPTCNIAYPRRLLEALDGFDESFPGVGGEDTDLAWRALESGSEATLARDAVVHHAVLDLGPAGMLRVANRWSPAVRIFRRHPGLRRELLWGVFWKRSHALLLLAGLGLAVGRKVPFALVLVVPYLRHLRARRLADSSSARQVPFYVLHDLVETYAVARGAASARVLAL